MGLLTKDAEKGKKYKKAIEEIKKADKKKNHYQKGKY